MGAGDLPRAPAYHGAAAAVRDVRVVRGLGSRNAAGATEPRRAPWFGFVAGADPAIRYSAWAVLSDGKSACRFWAGRELDRARP
jgi:hypothetical protein